MIVYDIASASFCHPRLLATSNAALCGCHGSWFKEPLRKVSLQHFSLFGRCVRAAAMCALVDSLQHLQLPLPYINNDR